MRPLLARHHRAAVAVHRRHRLFAVALLVFTRSLGQEFTPTLDEKNLAMHRRVRIPVSTRAVAGDAAGSSNAVIKALPRSARVFQDRHRRSGRRSDAAQCSDTFIILKPQSEWPARLTSKALLKQIEAEVAQLPGNAV
jgi:cobalt-zinc-cadmium resistance protein CzcA